MKKRTWSRLVKTTVCSACAATMVAAQCGSALAIGSMSKFEAPTSETSINKNVITIGAHTVGVGAEMLGLNQVTESSMSGTGLAACETSRFYGLYGTNLNEAPDPYVANFFYNAYAAENGKAQTAALNALGNAGSKPDRADLTAVPEYGNVSLTLAYRPDMLMGCDPKSFTSGNVIVLKSSGTPVAAAKSSVATSGYTEMVEMINNFKGTEFYQTGDENYDPYYIEFALWFGDASFSADGKAHYGNYSLYSHVLNGYRMAGVAEEILKSNSAKTTRYEDSPMEIAQDFESYVRGLQLYILSAIDKGDVEKRSFASVYTVDTDAKTVQLYKSSSEGSIECTEADVSSNFMGYYTESLENVATNIAGRRDASSTSTDGSGMLATVDAAELAKADVIILNTASDESALRSLMAGAGITQDKMPNICLSNAAAVSGRWHAESAQVVGPTLGFVYPEILNGMYATAYFFEKFYHVKSDLTSLSNAIGLAFSGNLSLAPGVTDNLSGYNAASIESKINNGLWYYAQNKASIDKTMPKLTIDANNSLPTKNPATAQTVKVTKNATKTVKASSVAAKKTTYTVNLSGVKTAVTATLGSAAKKAGVKVTVNSKKKLTVTVPKGIKAGTYKFTVKAKVSADYKASAAKTVTLKVS
ncbi:MAG: hypothetical protein ACI36Y_06135 [Coriobacteriales bacterium]